MRRLLLALAATAAALLAAVATAGATAPRPVVIHVVEHAKSDTVTDTGARGDSVGDLLTFANEVFDRSDTKHSGHDNGMCIRTIAGAAWECWWTTSLAGGQITVEGPFYDARNSILAITGGTRAYANARGWMELKSLAGGTKYDFIFHLTG